VETKTYTSKEQHVSDPIATEATLSCIGGTLGSTSLVGSSSTSFTVNKENYEKTEKSFTITSVCGDKKKTIEINQSGSVYELSWKSLAPSVDAAGGAVSLTAISLRNGNAHDFTDSDVTVSGLADVGVSVKSEGGGEYSVILDVPKNNSSESRSFTVKVTQPFSLDETQPIIVTQEAASQLKVARFMAGFSFNGTDYSKVIVTNARLSATGSDYGGGTVEDLLLKVINKKDGKEYGSSGNLGDFDVPNNGSVKVSVTEISNSSNTADNMAVEVWFGTEHQQTTDIVQMETT
jgi:hypothetical protein